MVVEIFGSMADPDYPESSYLEQYHTQLISMILLSFSAASSGEGSNNDDTAASSLVPFHRHPHIQRYAVTLLANYVTKGVCSNIDAFSRGNRIFESMISQSAGIKSSDMKIVTSSTLCPHAFSHVKLGFLSCLAQIVTGKSIHQISLAPDIIRAATHASISSSNAANARQELTRLHLQHLFPLWTDILMEFVLLRHPQSSSLLLDSSLLQSLRPVDPFELHHHSPYTELQMIGSLDVLHSDYMKALLSLDYEACFRDIFDAVIWSIENGSTMTAASNGCEMISQWRGDAGIFHVLLGLSVRLLIEAPTVGELQLSAVNMIRSLFSPQWGQDWTRIDQEIIAEVISVVSDVKEMRVKALEWLLRASVLGSTVDGGELRFYLIEKYQRFLLQAFQDCVRDSSSSTSNQWLMDAVVCMESGLALARLSPTHLPVALFLLHTLLTHPSFLPIVPKVLLSLKQFLMDGAGGGDLMESFLCSLLLPPNPPSSSIQGSAALNASCTENVLTAVIIVVSLSRLSMIVVARVFDVLVANSAWGYCRVLGSMGMKVGAMEHLSFFSQMLLKHHLSLLITSSPATSDAVVIKESARTFQMIFHPLLPPDRLRFLILVLPSLIVSMESGNGVVEVVMEMVKEDAAVFKSAMILLDAPLRAHFESSIRDSASHQSQSPPSTTNSVPLITSPLTLSNAVPSNDDDFDDFQ